MMEWSHSAEAYQNAEENIRNQPREWLEVVYAEWRGRRGDGVHNFDERKYARALRFAKAQTGEYLANAIWEWTEEYRTCTNGGHFAHTCPFGCGCHLVSFNRPSDQTGE